MTITTASLGKLLLLGQAYDIAGALGRNDGLPGWGTIGGWIALVVAVAVSIPILVFASEVWLASLLAGTKRIARLPDEARGQSPALSGAERPLQPRVDAAVDQASVPGPRVVVIVPAHNEEAVIGRTLDSLLPTLPADTAALVIADNCDDGTARIAAEKGAVVLERRDPGRRGKSYALAYAIERLRPHPPEVAVFLDADCLVNRETVQRLTELVRSEDRPIQVANLADSRGLGGTVGGLSALAFRFKNLVRPLGLGVIGGPCHLTGTGMAVPWRCAESLTTLDNHLAEDMVWGTRLAIAGESARLCPEVAVWSKLPSGGDAFSTQRTRWEQGHLSTLTRQTPRLLWQAFRQGRVDLALLAVDLAVPPFSLMVAIWLAVAVAMGVAFGWGVLGPLPLFVLLVAGVAMATSVLAGWFVFCRDEVPLRTLLATPVYIARKLPIYVRHLLHRGERRWIRTSRTATS